MHYELGELWFIGEDFKEIMKMVLIRENESYIFKSMIELIYPSYNVK